MHRGERWVKMRGQRQIVKSGNRNVIGYNPAAGLALQNCAIGQDVVSANHRGRRLVLGEQPFHRLAADPDFVGTFDHHTVRNAHAAILTGSSECPQTIGGPVVAFGHAGDDPKPMMPDVE